jgi:hypothetical protein
MNAGKMRFSVLLAVGLFGGGAAAQQTQEATDMHLEDAGFVMRAATPHQLDRVRLLPPRKFVARTVNGRRYFLYADPELCKCVFLGDELAMTNYQNMVSLPSSLPLPGGPGSLPPGASLYQDTSSQDMDPNLSSSISTGDILDYPN